MTIHARRQPQPPTEQPKSNQNHNQAGGNSAPTSPICRCRVMYLGSSVPHITKDGLQGIQEPLRELYPDPAALSSGNAGIDSWLSVWSNGILIENFDETGREVKRFFKIEALHYCAAVKFVPQQQQLQATGGGSAATLPHNLVPKFLPLDSPHARLQQDNGTHPPIFASILRRTTGVKVLECHAFICKREAAANALVRCCFHAYADTMYAKQIGAEIGPEVCTTRRSNDNQQQSGPVAITRRSKSIAALNDVTDGNQDSGEFSDPASSQRHTNNQLVADNYESRTSASSMMARRKSLNNGLQHANYANSNNLKGGGDMSDSSASQSQHLQQQQMYESNNLQKQTQRFSKSMHQLNQPYLDQTFNNFTRDGSLSSNNQRATPEPPPPPLFAPNPYASRVPSYPPQNIIDQQQQQLQTMNATGTLRSVKSVAANSIASTLLRSKKHAKAMSMAQLNQQQQPPMSFHQHLAPAVGHQNGGPGSFMTLPPVPPMFLPNLQHPRAGPIINGSQTMKLPSRHSIMPGNGLGPMQSLNFEAMTPKEMKKLLKKSAKYGIDPSKFVTDTGLPLMPLRPMPPIGLPPHIQSGFSLPNPKSGTFNSQSMFPMVDHQNQPLDLPDLASSSSAIYDARGQPYFGPPPPQMDLDPATGLHPIKSILVKPNPEFLKSKAGKKWLKQQKEFKKLLPAHLDGLPIVFGPPPLDGLETAAGGGPPPPPPHSFIHGQPSMPPPASQSGANLPVLDSNGFYNPHPLYGPSGRASAASTLMRNSPQVMQMHAEQQQHQEHMDYLQRPIHQQSLYSNPGMSILGYHVPPPQPPPPPPMLPPHLHQDDFYSDQPSSFDRQFHPVESTRRRSRSRSNHMVKQSVISLGDEENDDDDDGEDEDERRQPQQHSDNPHPRQNGLMQNGYYHQPESSSSERAHPQQRCRRKSSSNQDQQKQIYQDDYEQIVQQQQQQPMMMSSNTNTNTNNNNEDRNSNSSGIYRRRGHINERAFSYSIRQEASKSSADNSDAEFRNGELSDSNYANNNNHIDYRQSQAHYDHPQGNIYQNRATGPYYKQQQQQHMSQMHHPNPNRHQQQMQPADELTARLENQLNMKSFANSCVKSHM